MINYNAWLSAIRIRTLPLALASIGMGSFLAAEAGYFRWSVFLLCAITTIFLQILSNLANDYGDSIHGADSILRDGPSRAVQSGAIAPGIMRKAIALFVILSLVSGITLLYIALGLNIQAFLLFFFIGIMAIIAAIAYTAGKKPYGYAGLGDFSVFLFFGIVGVAGTYFLYVKEISWLLILPAVSCGMFATAVLNLNNVRDISSDKSAGKKSIPVRIGRDRAVIYHYLLLILGFITAFLFTVLYFKSYFQFLFILAVPLLVKNAIAIKTRKTAMELDPFLKQMAIATLVFVLMFGIGILL
ncbi:MAG: 1,4-dihydroxy-2-naphthoate polyprenyltransferase [Bacteroidota bacterium]|jgi:1,4-dihydroxy-2-naphthoate octaprenyltransferase|nr:1,4-dihydroxy-2-naphthoate polyprenyltransferase [Bacteroidota bacterium]